MLYFRRERGLLLILIVHSASLPRLSCRGVAQPGRAPGSGPWGRRFKFSLPDHFSSIFCSLKDQIKRLPVCRDETYAVRVAVQKHGFQQLTAFRLIPRKVQKMSLIREFKKPFDC